MGSPSDDRDPADVTRLLRRVREGDEAAKEELASALYGALHELARKIAGPSRESATMRPTVLVHEAWLRLFGGEVPEIEDRRHLFHLTARAMRRALVDHARKRAAAKRGGDRRVDLDESTLESWDRDPEELLALEEALGRLEARDADSARLVELRFFTGLTNDETAQVLGKTVRQVEGTWAFARGWLRRELERGTKPHGA